MEDSNLSGMFISVIQGHFDIDPYYWTAATGAHETYEAAENRRVFYRNDQAIPRDIYDLEYMGEHQLRQTGPGGGRYVPADIFQIFERD